MRLYSARQHAAGRSHLQADPLSQRATQGGPADRFGVSWRWDITTLASALPDYADSRKACHAYRLGPARDAGSVARCSAGPEGDRRPFSLAFVTKSQGGGRWRSCGVSPLRPLGAVVGSRPCVLYCVTLRPVARARTSAARGPHCGQPNPASPASLRARPPVIGT